MRKQRRKNAEELPKVKHQVRDKQACDNIKRHCKALILKVLLGKE